MTTPFLVTKSPKSIGIAILLTILFGPLGLFYASVSGALIMLLAPIFSSRTFTHWRFARQFSFNEFVIRTFTIFCTDLLVD